MGPLEKKARKIAMKAHRGQTRRDGKTPYWKHCEATASRMMSDLGKAVAWLHDVVEDNKSFRLTIEELVKKYPIVSDTFSREIWNAVLLLSKNSHAPYKRDYFEYIRMIKANELARDVKIADMISNLADKPTDEQIRKYARSILIILEH